ncbi:MAG: hypothetical protein LBN99_06980 [Oscillospiraceae bacterium]|jgi:hypothetical protein|nr:hypothetical protein [Oscillospiraceae bacterium]
MDLRVLDPAPEEDFTRYKPPESIELRGKQLSIALDDGSAVKLAFAGGDAPSHDCVKISENVFFISYVTIEACVSYVLDTATGLVTRVAAGQSGKAEISFGALADTPATSLHGFTADLAGNAAEWTLGTGDQSFFKVVYGDGGAELSRPRDSGAALAATDFKAVKIAEGIYLQNAAVTRGGEVFSVNLLSDFDRVKCVGNVFGTAADGRVFYRVIGGYGRIV